MTHTFEKLEEQEKEVLFCLRKLRQIADEQPSSDIVESYEQELKTLTKKYEESLKLFKDSVLNQSK